MSGSVCYWRSKLRILILFPILDMNNQPLQVHLLDSFLLPSQLEQFLGLEFSKTSLLYNHYIYCFQMLDKTNMILQVPHNSRHYCDCELVIFFSHDIQAVSHPNNLSMEEIQGMAMNRECLDIIND